MPPRIEIIGDAEKAAPFIIWAKQQWGLREGRWTKHVGDCLIQLFRSGDSGYIQFITQSNQAIAGNPHLKKDSQFVLDSYYGKIMSTPRPLGTEPYPSSEDKDIQFGNYSVLSKDDKAYSIKVPHHNLASDIGSSVKGYTQYSWTTNVSMEDVYTSYSEYVYSEGEAVFAGTMAPPEAAFKYSLIVGIGLDDKDVLHIAQLVQIPKDYGYWKIEKDGSNLGTFFGTFAQAVEKGAATLIWKNESDVKRWFVEFLTCDNGLDSELVTNLNIYRREDASRSTAQWFYKDGAWSQYTSSLPAKLKFDGIQEEAGLKKTRYSQALDAALVNSKPVVANHVATSLSGVIGTYSEITLPVNSVPSDTITFAPDPTWPAVSTGVNVVATGGCNTIAVSLSNLPGFSVSTIESGREYRVVREDRGTVCNAKIVNGSIVATNGRVTKTLPVYVAGDTNGLTPSMGCYPNCIYIYSYSKFYAYNGTAPYTWSADRVTFTANADGTEITITGAEPPPPDTSEARTITFTDACGRSVSRSVTVTGHWVTTSSDPWPYGSVPCGGSIGTYREYISYSGNTRSYRDVCNSGFRSDQLIDGTQYCRDSPTSCTGFWVSSTQDWNTWHYSGYTIDASHWMVVLGTVDSSTRYKTSTEGAYPCGINKNCSEYSLSPCIQYYGLPVVSYTDQEWVVF